LARAIFRAPVFFWRLGYGPLIGRLVLILTHIGRNSGKVRRTALEYHTINERIYVFSAWPSSDWFRNIQAEPRVTLQTHRGPMPALAHILETNADYFQAYELIEKNLMVREVLKSSGVDTSLTGFLANKERLNIVTFEPTALPTPPPLETDLKWVTPLVLGAFALGYISGRQDR
jgi:deazaflavin-dependent oxidoreductase (nitroreductase family)